MPNPTGLASQLGDLSGDRFGAGAEPWNMAGIWTAGGEGSCRA